MNYTDPQSVVHFVGLHRNHVAEWLGPTTEALVGTGLRQLLILADDSHARGPGAKLHSSVELVRVPTAHLSFAAKWRALGAALQSAVVGRSTYAVHLHGTLACLLGRRVLEANRIQARTLYSPYVSDGFGRFRAQRALLSWLLRTQCALLDHPPVASCASEAQSLSRITGRSADLIEFPVAPEFFRTPRRCGDTSLIVTSGDALDEAGVDLYTRLAVLLHFEEPPLRFSWIGQVGSTARAKLKAANVRTFETADDSDTARYLSQAWIYVQTSTLDESPMNVARAMAMGLPCLTTDTQAYRDLIRHGENGFICTSERDFIERLATLVTNPDERSKVGDAARAEAMRRFSTSHFRTRLLGLYGFDSTEVGAAALERQ